MTDKILQKLDSHWDILYRAQRNSLMFTWADMPSEFISTRILNFEEEGLKTVLDLGCGDCRDLFPFIVRGFRCTGVDISNMALRSARVIMKDLGVKGAKLLKMDITKLKLPSTYDIVISAKVFKHVWDTEAVLASVFPYINDGGVVVVEFAALEDGSHKKCKREGERVGGYKYRYKSGTMYRFHSREELEKLFSDFSKVEIIKYEYLDSPHDLLCNTSHKHTSWIVYARK